MFALVAALLIGRMATTRTQLLTLDEAAKRLAVLPARLLRWVKAGRVPAVFLPDDEPRFAPADLDKWIGDRSRPAEAEGARDE